MQIYYQLDQNALRALGRAARVVNTSESYAE